MKKIVHILITMLAFSNSVKSQFSEYNKGGLKINIGGEESRYIRFITINQVQIQFAENESYWNDINFIIRRTRIIFLSQITPDFLLFLHVGLNSLDENQMSPFGEGKGSQVILHDAWAEYKFLKEIYIGMGLHYWNGISRQNSQGTSNLLTMDAERSSWSSMGLSDQLGRHLGIYCKGNIDDFFYRFSINESMLNSDNVDSYIENYNNNNEGIFYAGKKSFGNKANLNLSGYFEYQFFDKELNKTPSRVGTYLGKKDVFNIGMGFFYHPNGLVKLVKNNDTISNISLNITSLQIPVDARHFAVDIYYDSSLGYNNSGINFYAKYQFSNMGENYYHGTQNNPIIGTGKTFYGHIGYLIPKSENILQNRIMPYLAYSNRDFEGLLQHGRTLRSGINWFIDAQTLKLTIEYRIDFHKSNTDNETICFQAQIVI